MRISGVFPRSHKSVFFLVIYRDIEGVLLVLTKSVIGYGFNGVYIICLCCCVPTVCIGAGCVGADFVVFDVKFDFGDFNVICGCRLDIYCPSYTLTG